MKQKLQHLRKARQLLGVSEPGGGPCETGTQITKERAQWRQRSLFFKAGEFWAELSGCCKEVPLFPGERWGWGRTSQNSQQTGSLQEENTKEQVYFLHPLCSLPVACPTGRASHGMSQTLTRFQSPCPAPKDEYKRELKNGGGGIP